MKVKKTYLRKVIDRLSTPNQRGYRWFLTLECGHRAERQGGQRGATAKRLVCFRCQLGLP